MTPVAADPEIDDTTDDTSTGDAFQDAYERAKVEHSPKEEQAQPDAASTATETDEDEPETATAEATTGEKTTATKATETGLISDAEFTALQAKHPDDPAGLRKALEGAFTKKTQSLADERRSVERLQSYADIIDAYEADPAATIKLLAKQHGVVLGADETTATAITEKTDEHPAVAPTLASFDYDVDKWSLAMTDWTRAELKREMVAATEPLKKQQEQLLGKAAVEQTESVMKALETQHPDWKDHEAEMFALSQKIQPNGMTELEYLDHLYETVTSRTRAKTATTDTEKRIADGVKAALDKMKKAAETTETTTQSTPEHQVRKGPSHVASFEEAAEAARRGERWE